MVVAALPFFLSRRTHKISYVVPLPEQAYREEALSDGQFVATHRSPAFEGAYWVCRPSFAFTITHVRSTPSATVEQEKPDTARRASDDSTTSGQINRSIVPLKAEESQLS